MSVDVQAQSSMLVFGQERAGGAANTQQVDGFVAVNARPSWRLPQGRGELFVAIENLLNADYEYQPGYPMPGTSVQVGVSVGRVLKSEGNEHAVARCLVRRTLEKSQKVFRS